ncbi:serine/threonine protein phosphatase PrpC [Pedobacter sp. CG_S7]|uniref:PP2C family protein-serine/threonine phosphatase n=1 Tax=Pedobacter sp. CG_S7 TaxID=3143930 RepID=UPI0033981490
MMTDNNIFGQTDIGRVRDNNEDAFVAEELLHSGFILGCVIDGVGGYEGGEVAAAMTMDCIKTNLFSVTADDVIPRMVGTLKLANDEIYNRKQLDTSLEKMACVLTLVLADVENNKFYYAHVGDTRLYLLRDKVLVKITQDHSFVGFLEDSGRLSESEAMSHPKRNEVNQALGFSSTASLKDDFIETGESPFLPGDTLLMCSDGLTDRIDKDQLTVILTQYTSLRAATAALVDAANDAGGHDNITVVLLKNNTKPLIHEAAKPLSKTAIFPAETNEAATPMQPLANSNNNVAIVKKQVKTAKNRGWVVFLLVVVVLLSGVLAWMFWQVNELQKRDRTIAPIYENPWILPSPNLQDTIKTPLRDTTFYKDTIPEKIKPNGTRTIE